MSLAGLRLSQFASHRRTSARPGRADRSHQPGSRSNQPGSGVNECSPAARGCTEIGSRDFNPDPGVRWPGPRDQAGLDHPERRRGGRREPTAGSPGGRRRRPLIDDRQKKMPRPARYHRISERGRVGLIAVFLGSVPVPSRTGGLEKRGCFLRASRSLRMSISVMTASTRGFRMDRFHVENSGNSRASTAVPRVQARAERALSR